jgi:hypothetical protein
MSIVVVERSYEAELTRAELEARVQAAAVCSQRQRARLRYSLLARGGLRAVCMYDAPDAESVRAVQHSADLPYDRIWSAQQLNHEHGTPNPRYETVLVEREFATPVTPALAEAASRAAQGCYQRNRSIATESLLALDGMRMFCLFRAPDAESVRNANLQWNAPFVRAWTAIVLEPNAT